MVFKIFGDVGLQVLEAIEEDGVILIRSCRILEWSLSPQIAESATMSTPKNPK